MCANSIAELIFLLEKKRNALKSLIPSRLHDKVFVWTVTGPAVAGSVNSTLVLFSHVCPSLLRHQAGVG